MSMGAVVQGSGQCLSLLLGSQWEVKDTLSYKIRPVAQENFLKGKCIFAGGLEFPHLGLNPGMSLICHSGK